MHLVDSTFGEQKQLTRLQSEISQIEERAAALHEPLKQAATRVVELQSNRGRAEAGLAAAERDLSVLQLPREERASREMAKVMLDRLQELSDSLALQLQDQTLQPPQGGDIYHLTNCVKLSEVK